MDTPDPETGPRRPVSIGGALRLLLVGVIGTVVVTWVLAGSSGSPQVLVALDQVFTACTLTGAVWLGALLACQSITHS